MKYFPLKNFRLYRILSVSVTKNLSPLAFKSSVGVELIIDAPMCLLDSQCKLEGKSKAIKQRKLVQNTSIFLYAYCST